MVDSRPTTTALCAALFALMSYPRPLHAADIEIISVAPAPALLQNIAKRAGKSFEAGKKLTVWSLAKELNSKLLDAKTSMGGSTTPNPIELSLQITAKPLLSPGHAELERELVVKACKPLTKQPPSTLEAVLKAKNESTGTFFVIFRFSF